MALFQVDDMLENHSSVQASAASMGMEQDVDDGDQGDMQGVAFEGSVAAVPTNNPHGQLAAETQGPRPSLHSQHYLGGVAPMDTDDDGSLMGEADLEGQRDDISDGELSHPKDLTPVQNAHQQPQAPVADPPTAPPSPVQPSNTLPPTSPLSPPPSLPTSPARSSNVHPPTSPMTRSQSRNAARRRSRTPTPQASPAEGRLLPEAANWPKGWGGQLPTHPLTDPEDLKKAEAGRAEMVEKIAISWTAYEGQATPQSTADGTPWEDLPAGCEDVRFKMGEAEYRHQQKVRDQYILDDPQITTNILSDWSARLRGERKLPPPARGIGNTDGVALCPQNGGMMLLRWCKTT